MYRFIRQTHLYCGLLLLLMLLMYCITGMVMTHGQLFPKRDRTETRREEAITYNGDRAAESLLSWARERFDIAGRSTQASARPNGDWELRYANAGSETVVQIPAAFDKATVITRSRNVIDSMVMLHRMHGYHGGWLYVMWALLCDIAGISLVLFGITGIWMWYTLTRKRAFGWALLALSFSFPSAIVTYLLISR